MSEQELNRLTELAKKGEAGPASLTPEERRELCLLTLKRMNLVN